MLVERPLRDAAIDTSELVLKVTAKTYRYLDEEEQAPAAGSKKASKKNKKKAAGA